MRKYIKSLLTLISVFVIATVFYSFLQSITSLKSRDLPATPAPSLSPQILTDRYNAYYSVLMTPDGKKILTGNSTKKTTVGNTTTISGYGVQVWDAKSLRLLSTFGVQSGVSPLAITPDGKKVVIGWDGGYNEDTGIAKSHALVYELATGKKILQMPEGTGTTSFAISPNGNILALGSTKYLELRDLKTGHLLRRMKRWLKDPASSWAVSPTFSPDGKRLAFIDTLAESADVYANGKRDEIGIFSVQSGRRLRILRWKHTNIQNIAFSPDGKFLAVIAWIYRWPHAGQKNLYFPANRILICDAHTGHVRHSLDIWPQADNLAFSPNGNWLAVSSRGNGVQVWNTTNWKLHIDPLQYKPTEADKFVYSIAFTPDSKTLLVGANKVSRIPMQQSPKLSGNLPLYQSQGARRRFYISFQASKSTSANGRSRSWIS